MKNKVKKTIRFAAGTCAALSVVTLGAVAASSTAVKVLAESLKAGFNTMIRTAAELRTEPTTEVSGEPQESAAAEADADDPEI